MFKGMLARRSNLSDVDTAAFLKIPNYKYIIYIDIIKLFYKLVFFVLYYSLTFC